MMNNAEPKDALVQDQRIPLDCLYMQSNGNGKSIELAELPVVLLFPSSENEGLSKIGFLKKKDQYT